jgi:serine protease Do
MAPSRHINRIILAMNTSFSQRFNRRRALWAAGALALAGAFAAGAQSNDSNAIALKRDPQPVTRGQLERASFSDVVKRVSPSVVKITTETKAKRVPTVGRGNEFNFDDPLFRQFFGNRQPQLQQQPMSGLGSGVVISADGYIATNNHVVEGADTLNVSLADGRELKAKVVGRDPLTDIAVIKVDAKDLPAVTFADTSKIEVGDRVLAIGNPFGIGETVTSGIVSAKGRRVGILEDVQGFEDFIQTDAAINPGNSGGALVDVDGRLIGINTAILSRTGGFQGVGLAVPANLVSSVADQLVKSGKVVRGYLGVSIQTVTPQLAEAMDLKKTEGALIADVEPDSPAAKAGLKSHDVVTAVNGQPVKESYDLKLAVSSLAPGTKLNLDILRDGKTKQITATAGDNPNARKTRGGDEALSQNDDDGVLNGVSVDDLNRDARQQFNIPARVKGAVVTEVDPDSAAARAGLRAGDVILEINKHPVNSAQEAVDLTSKTENKKTLLKLWSRGGTIFVAVDETGTSKGNS